jgi:hypothetical protein
MPTLLEPRQRARERIKLSERIARDAEGRPWMEPLCWALLALSAALSLYGAIA